MYDYVNTITCRLSVPTLQEKTIKGKISYLSIIYEDNWGILCVLIKGIQHIIDMYETTYYFVQKRNSTTTATLFCDAWLHLFWLC